MSTWFQRHKTWFQRHKTWCWLFGTAFNVAFTAINYAQGRPGLGVGALLLTALCAFLAGFTFGEQETDQ